MYHFTALVTCLALLFYFFTSIQVSKARTAFGIKVPAISGHPDFERVFRVQMNTLEWMPVFLPSLWLFAVCGRCGRRMTVRYHRRRGAAGESRQAFAAWCVYRDLGATRSVSRVAQECAKSRSLLTR